MAIDKETADRIDLPIAAEAEHEARLTPAEAIERMRINVPVRGNRKLRTLIERVNSDKQHELAGKLMQGQSIPQLILFRKTATGWSREQLTGAHSVQETQSFISRSADS